MGPSPSVHLIGLLAGLLLGATPVAPVYEYTGANPSGACTGSRVWINSTSGVQYCCVTGTWSACGASGGAPGSATYITQTPDATLSAEQALSGLSTGVLGNTTGTGVLSTIAPFVAFGGTYGSGYSFAGAPLKAGNFVKNASYGAAGAMIVSDSFGTGLQMMNGQAGTTNSGDLLFLLSDGVNSVPQPLAYTATGAGTFPHKWLRNPETTGAPSWATLAAADLPVATASTAGAVTAPTCGAGSFYNGIAAGVLNCAAGGGGGVTSVTGNAPISSSGGSTPAISISMSPTFTTSVTSPAAILTGGAADAGTPLKASGTVQLRASSWSTTDTTAYNFWYPISFVPTARTATTGQITAGKYSFADDVGTEKFSIDLTGSFSGNAATATALSTAGAAHQFWKNGNAWAAPDWSDLTSVPATFTATAHTLMGATHSDVDTAATSAGDVIVRNAGNTQWTHVATVPMTSGGTGAALTGTVGALLAPTSSTVVGQIADVAVGSALVSGGVNAAPAYSASATCTSSAATTCTITGRRAGCLPICSMTTSVSTTMRAALSSTTITCTFGTSGTNTCNCLCF